MLKSNFPFYLLIYSILITGILLRVVGGLDTILFTYDQARDALIAQAIAAGDFKITGPASDIPGLFHGPLFYYLIAPFYAIAGGNPQVVLLAMIFINLIAAVPFFLLCQKLFNNHKISLLALLLYMVSFEAISYARWISNPSLAVPALALFYLGLWQLISGQKTGLLLVAVGAGIASQSQLFLIYLVPLALAVIYFFKVQSPGLWKPTMSALVLLAFLSSYALAEFKFRFQGITSFLHFLSANLGNSGNFAVKIENYFSKFKSLLTANLIPTSELLSTVLGITLIAIALYFAAKQTRDQKPLRFLLLMLFSNVPIFLVSPFNSHYVNVGLIFPLMAIAAFVLLKIYTKFAIVALGLATLIITSNIYTAAKLNKLGNRLFQVQDNMRLKDELELVRSTYQIANGQVFSISAATNPLFYPTTWAFLYDYYAKTNNLKLPHYHGNTDPAFTGVGIFPRSGEITAVEFTIVEPDLPVYWKDKIIADDDLRKPATQELQFGTFTLIVRK